MDIDEINNYSKKQFKSFLEKLNDKYYNDTEIVTDEEYDLYKELYISKFGSFNNIGAEPKTNLVKLPVFLGSLNKLKTEKQYEKFNLQKPFIVESKLDGITGLYFNNKLYTRGNGKIGNDISYLLPYLNFPKINFNVRGEFVINKNVYDEKYKHLYKSERTFVSAVINTKEISNRIKDIIFIAYQIIDSDENVEEQLKKIKKYFETPKYKKIENIKLSNISNILHDFIKKEKYLLDGIVIISNNSKNTNIDSNPSNAIAYKENMTKYNVNVITVHWSIGKTGKYNPIVEFEPILDGKDTLKYATGKSGKFIFENNIGENSKLIIERSGGIIPNIIFVTKGTTAKMPEKYIWKGEHIYTLNSDEYLSKKIHYFFKIYEIKNIGPSKCKSFVDNNYSLIDILKITKEELRKIFAEKTSQNIFDSIKNIKYNNLITLMDASGVFEEGIASKILNTINNTFPILTSTYEKLMTVKGISDITAFKILNGIPLFLEFLNKTGIKVIESEGACALNENKLFNETYVFSGFRDKKLKEFIEKNGGIVSENLTKSSILICDKNYLNSTKYKQALDYNLKIYLKDDFIKIYKENNNLKEDIFIDNLSGKRIVLFDFDYTLVRPKSNFISKDRCDWELWNENVVPYLQSLNSKYDIVLATNQSKTYKVDMIVDFINEMKKEGLNISACICSIHKKPDTTFILKCLEHKKISFHCGDATGENGAWSDADKQLAMNLNIKFIPSYEYFKLLKNNKTIYLMVGIPGSGKTTYIENNMKNIKAKVIHRDEIKDIKVILKNIVEILKKNDNVIVDACNTDYLKRKVFIDLANKNKFKIVAVSIIIDKDKAIDRDSKRTNKVNAFVINIIANKYSKPSLNEGFDEIIEIDNN